MPREKYTCSYTFNICITNEIIGVNNADIQPAWIHINFGCNSNFIYLDDKISNTYAYAVGILKVAFF